MPPDPDEGFLNDVPCVVFIADEPESERESIPLVRFHQLPKRPDVPLLAPGNNLFQFGSRRIIYLIRIGHALLPWKELVQ